MRPFFHFLGYFDPSWPHYDVIERIYFGKKLSKFFSIYSEHFCQVLFKSVQKYSIYVEKGHFWVFLTPILRFILGFWSIFKGQLFPVPQHVLMEIGQGYIGLRKYVWHSVGFCGEFFYEWFQNLTLQLKSKNGGQSKTIFWTVREKIQKR